MSYDIYSAAPNTANTALNIESGIFGVAEYGKYPLNPKRCRVLAAYISKTCGF